MNGSSLPVTARAIIPSLRYVNALRAIDFLCATFGFEQYALYLEADGSVDYAQLRLGSNFIMLSSALASAPGPADATRGFDVVLECAADVDAHCTRSRAAGATIVRKLESSYGGHRYSASDCEGNLWNFSSKPT